MTTRRTGIKRQVKEAQALALLARIGVPLTAAWVGRRLGWPRSVAAHVLRALARDGRAQELHPIAADQQRARRWCTLGPTRAERWRALGEARERGGVTFDALAVLADLPRARVTVIVTGMREPTLTELDALERALGLDRASAEVEP